MAKNETSRGATRVKRDAQNRKRRITIGGITSVVLVLAAVVLFRTPNQTSEPMASTTATVPYPDVPRISLEEAKVQFDAGTAFLIDLRGKDSFDAERIPGSIWAAADSVLEVAASLPKDAEIITICT